MNELYCSEKIPQNEQIVNGWYISNTLNFFSPKLDNLHKTSLMTCPGKISIFCHLKMKMF